MNGHDSHHKKEGFYLKSQVKSLHWFYLVSRVKKFKRDLLACMRLHIIKFLGAMLKSDVCEHAIVNGCVTTSGKIPCYTMNKVMLKSSDV